MEEGSSRIVFPFHIRRMHIFMQTVNTTASPGRAYHLTVQVMLLYTQAITIVFWMKQTVNKRRKIFVMGQFGTKFTFP